MKVPIKIRPSWVLAVVIALPGVFPIQPAEAQTSNAKGKLSRNFYRIPYGNGTNVDWSRDYIDHGNTPAGDVGSMDVNAVQANPLIVAPADGTVVSVSDNLNGCGCHANYGPCANVVQIDHANGERSTYLHIAFNSATVRGITVGAAVVAGQAIGVEGDVGWTCGSGTNPRTSACVPVVPNGATACGPHLHWNVVRTSTGERVNPVTCGIGNNIYVDGGDYTAAACSTAGCSDTSILANLTLDAFGEWRVFQANDLVTASTVTVSNFASMVMHAGNRVRMLPGFHADAGGYVRAEIGACNTTAFAPPAVTADVSEDSPLIDLWYETEGY